MPLVRSAEPTSSPRGRPRAPPRPPEAGRTYPGGTDSAASLFPGRDQGMTTLQEPIAHAPLPATKSPDDSVTPRTTRPVRVAVVDDDDDFRRALCFHLSDQGLEAVACSGGRAALELLGTESVDVILLDWRMPDMNGLEVLRELRQRGTMTPVIFLTGLADEVFEEAALAGGAVDFVDKSRRLSILMRRIELIAEGQRPLPDPSQQPPSQGDGARSSCASISIGVLAGRRWLHATEFRMIARSPPPGEDVPIASSTISYTARTSSRMRTDGTARTSAPSRIRRKFREIDGTFDCIGTTPGRLSLTSRWVLGFGWRGIRRNLSRPSRAPRRRRWCRERGGARASDPRLDRVSAGILPADRRRC